MPKRFTAAPIVARTKGEVKRLRKSGFIPVSIQHKGRETIHLQEELRPLEEYVRQYGESSLLEIAADPGPQLHTVIVHDVQRHPITHRFLHVTYQAVERNESIKMHVNLVFHGEPEAVSNHTAMAQHQSEQVEIRCLAGKIPEHIVVEIGSLAFGDSIRVGDLPKNDHYEILTPAETVLISLSSVTSGQAETETAAAETAAPTP